MRKAVLSLTVLTASKRMMLTLLAASLVGMVVLFGVGIKSAETQTTPSTTYYDVQDLGTLGGSSSYAFGINDAGKVVGHSVTSSGETHAFLYDSTNGMTDLGTFGGRGSGASDINDAGQVVGSSDISDGSYHAFLYDTESATPKMQDLGTLEGGVLSQAMGINDAGKVVGYSYTSDGEQHGFLYDTESATPKMQDLNDLIPADSPYTGYIDEAMAINSDGKIAAYGDKCPPYGECWTAFVLTPATTATPATYEVQDLGTFFEGEPLYAFNSYAMDINDSGKVVGSARYWCSEDSFSGVCDHAFLYDEGASPKMQHLGSLGESTGEQAAGINDSGQVQVVGSSYHAGWSNYHAFIYGSTNGMKDLNTLIPVDSGWTIQDATAINTNGKIAAYGYKSGGGTHALLLTPTNTPVPDTTAPKVDSFTPSPDGVTGVSLSTTVTATFSEDMDPNTLSTSTFMLTKQGSTTPLKATVSYDATAKKATLKPSALNRNVTYTATVKGGANGVKDKAGNALASDKVWSFTTAKK